MEAGRFCQNQNGTHLFALLLKIDQNQFTLWGFFVRKVIRAYLESASVRLKGIYTDDNNRLPWGGLGILLPNILDSVFQILLGALDRRVTKELFQFRRVARTTEEVNGKQ